MTADVIGVFIPIVAIVLGIGMGMLSTWTEHKRRSQLLEQSHRERMVALEKGQPLPDLPAGLISGKSDDANPRNAPLRAMRSGLTLLGIGIVLFFALGRVTHDDVALFGLIPAVIGLANLVYAGLLVRKEREAGPGQG
jgi:cadmium resistance protein CadD (predicted permease)